MVLAPTWLSPISSSEQDLWFEAFQIHCSLACSWQLALHSSDHLCFGERRKTPHSNVAWTDLLFLYCEVNTIDFQLSTIMPQLIQTLCSWPESLAVPWIGCTTSWQLARFSIKELGWHKTKCPSIRGTYSNKSTVRQLCYISYVNASTFKRTTFSLLVFSKYILYHANCLSLAC